MTQLDRRAKRSILLLSVVAIAGLAVTEREGSYLLLAVGAAVLAWHLVEKAPRLRVPRMLINACVLAALGYACVEIFVHRTPAVPALAICFVRCQVIKYFQIKTGREYGEMIVLSMMVMITAAALSADVMFAVVLLVYLYLGVHTLLLFGLKRSADGNGYVLLAHAEMHRDNPSGVSYRIKRFLEDDAVGIETSRQPKGRSRRVSVRDLHSCRHTFCYLAAIHGVPFPIVKDIVGHVDSRITEIYMNHASREAKQESLRGLPNYLGLPEPASSPLTPQEQAAELLRQMTDDNKAEWPALRDRALKLLDATGERVPSAQRQAGASRDSITGPDVDW